MNRSAIAATLGCGALALACNGILGLQEPTIDDTINSDGATTDAPSNTDGPSGDVIASDSGLLPLVSGRIRRIAVDGSFVYYTMPFTPSTVAKVAKDGSGQPVTLAGDVAGGSHPDQIQVDDANIYWITSAGVRQCDKVACSSVIALVSENSPYNVYGIAVDTSTIYFLDVANGSAIRSVQKGVTLGTVSTLAPESALCASINAIKLVSGYVYYTCDDGPVGRVSTANGTVQVLSDGSAPASTFGLTISTSTVFYTLFSQPGAVMSLPSSGVDAGAATVASNVANGFAIDMDATHLYWTAMGAALDGSKGTVSRCTIGSCDGTKSDLVTDLHAPTDVHVDGAVLFYAVFGLNSGQGEGVYRLVLP